MDDETAVLLAIETLRSNPEYHTAEVLRRKTVGGSAAMAATSEGSAERSAVLLLIGTWESISVLMDGLKKRDKIFEVTPICHMYRELKAGIEALGVLRYCDICVELRGARWGAPSVAREA